MFAASASVRWLLTLCTTAALLPVPAIAAWQVPPVALSAPHERLLPLQGGQNFRDLGGYRTGDGRAVRWGLLYRSGSMQSLTPADYVYLEKRGIRTVCDFRSTEERERGPSHWPDAAAPHILSDDYPMAALSADMRMTTGTPPTAESARVGMKASYPAFLVRFNSQYRRMFGELLAGRVPLAFNCSAGKDRTGIAAALILTALGVSREDVVQDYLLTNQYLTNGKLSRGGASAATAQPPVSPVMQAYMVADRSYIEAALAVIEGHEGGTAGYLRDELGLGVRELANLRRMYTA